MQDTKRKLITAIATGALLLNAFAPLAFADTTIQISGNGTNSTNNADVNITQNTTVVQNNNATVTNNVSANADTGGNKAKDNTGGSVSIDTGDASTNVTVNNTLNQNQADVQCCDLGDTTVKISGNGSDTNNTANLTSNNTTNVYQSNNAKVKNYIYADADTGGNKAKDNTGGSVSITTGDADTNVDASTTANSNMANVGGNGGSRTLSLWIVGNGTNSDNSIKLALDNSTNVIQDNKANVKNYIYADADTGDNKAKDNTGGDVEIDTGDANANVDVDNNVNFNFADVDCGCLIGDLEVKVAENGSDSDNSIIAALGGEQNVFQSNCGKQDGIEGLGEGHRHHNKCEVKNNIDVDADSGDNKAKDNTGGVGDDPSITTGDADASSNVSNSGNVNILGNADFDLPDFDFNLNFSLTLSQLLALLHLLG